MSKMTTSLLKLSFILLLVTISGRGFSQTPILIPDTLSGSSIDLTVQTGTMEFYPGYFTQTVGYNGAYLGPTLILHKGQNVTLNVHNQLGDTTTVHWHGLHVAPMNDGNQHNPILNGVTWSPSFTVMDQACTDWYHPHPHGKTLQQVVKGASGFIIVRDEQEAALVLPRTYGVDDFPIVFQFKTFDANKQFVLADDADNAVLVNGTLNGMINLPAQVVRLRLLNGSSNRVFRFGFPDNRNFYQIGSDEGLLDAPVSLSRLNLGPGERAEVLLDLSVLAGTVLTLKSFGNELPQGYPGGSMMMGGAVGPLDNTTFNLLQINVSNPTLNPVTSIPTTLIANTPFPQNGASTRTFTFSAQPMMSMTNFFINGVKYNKETINFSTVQGRTEIWTLTNQTMMAHPFHVHGNPFYILKVNNAVPPANERGRKDVVMVPPMGGSVQVITRFDDFSDPNMPYIYHCHILSHEEGGMMGQFIVNPAPVGTEENTAQKHVRVYPSLVSRDEPWLNIDTDIGWEVLRAEVYDQLGRLLLRVENPGDQIPGGSFSSGLNVVKLFTASDTATFKIIQQ